MKVHQLLYGYNEGHQLLAGSIILDSLKDNMLLDTITDWTGFVPTEDQSSPYMVSSFLSESNMYAICLTWYADEMNRSGCVWSHVLLVDVDEISPDFNFLQLLKLFRRPDSKDFHHYTEAFDVVPNRTGITVTMAHWDQTEVTLFYNALLKNKAAPVYEDRKQAYYHILGLSLLNYLPTELLKISSICTGYTRHLEYLDLKFGLKISNDPESYFEGRSSNQNDSSYDDRYDGIKFIGKYILNAEEHLFSLIRAFSADIGADIEKLNAVGRILNAIIDDKEYDSLKRISIVFDVLNRYFPKFHEGEKIKTIVLSKDFTDIYTTEKDFFYVLSVTNPGVYFDTKMNIDERIANLLRTDNTSFLDLIEMMLEDNTRLNNYSISIFNISLQLSGNEIFNELVNKYCDILYPIIQKNDNFLSSYQLTKLKPEDVVNIVNGLGIDRLSIIRDWDCIVHLLDNPNVKLSSDLLAFLRTKMNDWIMPLLDRHNKSFPKKNTILLRIALEDNRRVVDWIANQYEIDENLKIQIAKSLNPNSLYIKNMGEDIWYHFAEWESKAISLEFNIFKFKLGFNWSGGLAQHYVREAFYILHEKLKDERYNKYIWDRMSTFCSDIFVIKYWDKCAILRKKVAKYFIDNNIHPSSFNHYTPNPVLNKVLYKTYKTLAPKQTEVHD